MKKTSKLGSAFCSLLTMFGITCKVSPCRASIPPRLLTDTDYNQLAEPRQITLFFPSAHDLGRGQDARLIQPVNPTTDITSADVGRFIPATKMGACQSAPGVVGAPVGTAIFGYSLSNFMQSPTIKQSSVGRTANTVQNSMKTEASFGGSEPGATKHSIAFNMNPIETKAEMKYKGFTNASLTYNMTVSKLDFEMYRDLTKMSKLVYNHIDTRDDHRDLVSWRWIWH